MTIYSFTYRILPGANFTKITLHESGNFLVLVRSGIFTIVINVGCVLIGCVVAWDYVGCVGAGVNVVSYEFNVLTWACSTKHL